MASILSFPGPTPRGDRPHPLPDFSALIDPETDLETLAPMPPAPPIPGSDAEGLDTGDERAHAAEVFVLARRRALALTAPAPEAAPGEAILALIEDLLAEDIQNRPTASVQPIDAARAPLDGPLLTLHPASIVYLLDILGYAGLDEGDQLVLHPARLLDRIEAVLEAGEPYFCSEIGEILDAPALAVNLYRPILSGLRVGLHTLPEGSTAIRIG